MSGYAQQLNALHTAAIVGDDAAMLALIKPARLAEFPIADRLQVYQGGYAQRLSDTVQADYPTLAHYLDGVVMQEVVTAYVRATPSLYWDLNFYSFGFANFLKTHASDMAAHDLATLESAITEVFWLPDSEALTADILKQLSTEDLANHRFKLCTACQLLALNYAANDYLAAFRNAQPLPQLVETPEYLAIIRYDNEVQRIMLDAAEYQILYHLQQGLTFGATLDAVAKLPDIHATQLAENLSSYLVRWFSYGFFKI